MSILPHLHSILALYMGITPCVFFRHGVKQPLDHDFVHCHMFLNHDVRLSMECLACSQVTSNKSSRIPYTYAELYTERLYV